MLFRLFELFDWLWIVKCIIDFCTGRGCRKICFLGIKMRILDNNIHDGLGPYCDEKRKENKYISVAATVGSVTPAPKDCDCPLVKPNPSLLAIQ